MSWQHRRAQDVSLRKIINLLEVPEVLAGNLAVGIQAFRQRRRDSALGGVAARMLCGYLGLFHREVADELHLGRRSAVVRQLTMLNDRLEADRNWGKPVATAEGEVRRRRHGSSFE